MKTIINFFFIGLLFLLLLTACKRQIDPTLKKALDLAGENKPELIKVLNHYSQNAADSLKLKAARFLIANMRNKYTYFGNAVSPANQESSSSYQPFFDTLGLLWHTDTSYKYKKSRTKELYNKYQVNRITSTLYLRNDLTFIKAGYLIDNIEQAFDAWETYPWSARISFHDFCNYILPYKVFSEPLERWRTEIRKRFSWVQDSLSTPASLIEAAALINNSIKDEVGFCATMGKLPDALSFSVLKKIGVGKCDHQVTYEALVMRAMGIPARVDYVPFRTNSTSGHTWISIKAGNNKLYAFTALYGNSDDVLENPDNAYKHPNIVPIMRRRPDTKVPKVFRKTYKIHAINFKKGRNLHSHAFSLIMNNDQIDVTAEYYLPVVDLELQFNDNYNEKYAYLSAFTGGKWIVTSRGVRRNDGKYHFKDIAAGLVYLPMGYQNDSLSAIYNPILVTNEKRVHQFNPNWKQPVRSMSIRRKYPVQTYLKRVLKRNIGGIFQGANQPDFMDAVNLYTIDTMPYPGTNHYSFNKSGNYRYVRFILPDRFCRVAEMHFTTKQSGSLQPVVLEGTVISSDFDEEKSPQNITDENPLSYFVSKAGAGGWAGFDLGKKHNVSGVAFYPPNDGNTVEKGDVYQLYYWNHGWQSKWVKKRADKEELIFKNVPDNALFLLHDLTKGKDERIFIYENGKQVWY